MKMIVLDDNVVKLRVSTDTAREILGVKWEIESILIQFTSTLTCRELAQDIMSRDPTIVVLDNTLMCAVEISGVEVAGELRNLGYHGLIIANTYGLHGWSDRITRQGWQNYAETDLGAGSPRELMEAIRTALSRLP